ncbi:MAG: 2-succinyl-5-enolpyruvyl-6-hydroxy-3-cyclohexene-1-carboxylic-acid synthase [Synechococcaceae cyanobacterium]
MAPDPGPPLPLGPRAPAAAPLPPQLPPSCAGANVRAALTLLLSLRHFGLTTVVVCPGSRSAPLAVAAGLLEPWGLRLRTALDERSAAFFALGCGRAEGLPTAVITTSGSAVAHLLPAAVEADYGSIPLLLLTADRPQRLKDCGANQSVNQERFLLASCRWFAQAAAAGLATMPEAAIEELAQRAMAEAKGHHGQPPGAVHLNLPLEEPLHATAAELDLLVEDLRQDRLQAAASGCRQPRVALRAGPALNPAQGSPPPSALDGIDPDQPGLIVAGPWRGSMAQRTGQIAALAAWQRRCGWPLLADALSGLRGCPELEVIAAYDLILQAPAAELAPAQVLRLGPLPASRRLQDWLQGLEARQALISEGDPRPLDPLRRCRWQWGGGFEAWWAAQPLPPGGGPAPQSLALARAWRRADARVQELLDHRLSASTGDPAGPAPGHWASASGHPASAPATVAAGDPRTVAAGAAGAVGAPQAPAAAGMAEALTATAVNEPWLARQLARLLPPQLPLMLANSSPVRDWESFAPGEAPPRVLFSFRGASGIDGTLSIACGLAEALGELVLICGDLALLHDSSGWLWRHQLGGRLSVVLIDNGGGGIFEQLPIRAGAALDFERLFAMPQPLDPLRLAELHGVPCDRLREARSLALQLRQLLERPADQPLGLLAIATEPTADASLRQRLRQEAAAAGRASPPGGDGGLPTMASDPPDPRRQRP